MSLSSYLLLQLHEQAVFGQITDKSLLPDRHIRVAGHFCPREENGARFLVVSEMDQFCPVGTVTALEQPCLQWHRHRMNHWRRYQQVGTFQNVPVGKSKPK